MPISDAKKRSNAKYDRAHMTNLSCRVRKEYAAKVKEKAAEKGTNVNAILLKAIKNFMEE